MKPWHGLTILGLGVLSRLACLWAYTAGRGWSSFQIKTADISLYLLIAGAIIYLLAALGGSLTPTQPKPKD